MLPTDGDDISGAVDRRMALAREWDELVEEVRKLPGFEDFLKPPPIEKLLPAASGGPVAIINVSRWRCDALLVRPDGVTPVELRKLNAEDVELRVTEYLEVLRRVADRTREHRLAQQQVAGGDASESARLAADRAARQRASAEQRAEAVLRSTLLWLWDTTAEPVLRELGFIGTPPEEDATKWPRLWWCPTGLLTLLPLHAAGDHLAEGADRPTVLDRVVSSYTPTLRALVEARAAAAPEGDPRMLLVTVADAPGEQPLGAVGEERDTLRALFDGRLTVLDGAAATVAEVSAQLPAHSWIHISSHADQLLDDPSRGGLRLFDGMLTIAEISARRYRGEFAFLSACKTATGGVSLADEAITLAAALHYTGYRHVIATLSSVFDKTAAAVAAAVYADGFTPEESAVRLHRAIRPMRDVQRLSKWTPFTHTGP